MTSANPTAASIATHSTTNGPHPPRVGMVGGGQLAQMTHQAAIGLGVELVVLAPDAGAPAVRAGASHVVGRADRLDDLLALAASCDVVTLDHEQAPAELLSHLAQQGTPVRPGPLAAQLGQDKAAARTFLGSAEVPMAPWREVADLDDVLAAGCLLGWPLWLKRTTGGYDGRGVWRADGPADAARLVGSVPGPLIAEPAIAFERELSVLVVRSPSGQVAAYPPVVTVQQAGQCHEVFAPAPLSADRVHGAQHLAVRIAELIALEGTMAVELFDTPDGLLLNELALRPHNSGHLTIEANVTSQFENHLRAVLDLPLGSTDLVVGGAAMVNVLGRPDGTDPFDDLAEALAVRGARVHRYGKAPRPGRKVGHVTATATTTAEARSVAGRAARALAGVTR